MYLNEAKDVYVSAKNRINKEMFNNAATDADCKIIADYINACVKYYNDTSPSINIVKFKNIPINGLVFKSLIVSIDIEDILKLNLKLINNKTVHFIFDKNGNYHVSGFNAISSNIKDFLVSWGLGIIKYLY